jgi:hypothetical protein
LFFVRLLREGQTGSIEATMAGKTTKANLHRATLRACLRLINTAESLGQARIQLARLLNVFDKLEARGITGDAAVKEAEERLAITPPPKTSRADERPVGVMPRNGKNDTLRASQGGPTKVLGA